MATLYALHGYIGSGKTTFAKMLEQRHDAIRFTIDDVIGEIFGPNPPHIDHANTLIRGIFYVVSKRLLRKGIAVVLDLGYWKRIDRDNLRKYAAASNANLIFYNVACEEKVALNRNLARTGKEQPLSISESDFYELKKNSSL